MTVPPNPLPPSSDALDRPPISPRAAVLAAAGVVGGLALLVVGLLALTAMHVWSFVVGLALLLGAGALLGANVPGAVAALRARRHRIW